MKKQRQPKQKRRLDVKVETVKNLRSKVLESVSGGNDVPDPCPMGSKLTTTQN